MLLLLVQTVQVDNIRRQDVGQFRGRRTMSQRWGGLIGEVFNRKVNLKNH